MLIQLSKWFLYALTLTPLLVWKGLFYQYSTAEALFVMAVVEVMSICFVWAAYKDPSLRPRMRPVAVAFFVFLVVLVLASVLGVDPALSFWSSFDRLTGVVFWFHLFVLLFIGSNVLRTPADWRGFFLCSTSIGIVVSVLHLLAFTGLDGVWLIHRNATIANSTFFGVYLLFQLAFGLILFVTASKGYKMYAACAIALFAVALSMSEAQAVILSSLGGLVLLLALVAMTQKRSHVFVRAMGTVVVIVLVLVFFIGLFELFDSGSSIRQWFVEYSSGSRFALWDMAWEGIKDRPVFGWGPENFGTVFEAYYKPCFGSSECGAQSLYDRAHNKVLDLWIETGIVGLAAYLALFLLAFRSLWRARESHGFVVPAMVASALAVYFVQNLVVLDAPLTLLFLVLLLAFADHLGRQSEEKKKEPRPFPASVAVVGSLCAAGIFFVAVYQPLQANLSIAQWFEAQSAPSRLAAFDRATGLSWVGLDERRAFMARQSAGAIWIAGIRGETLGSTTGEELRILEERLGESLERNPRSLSMALNLALVLHTQTKFFGLQDYTQTIQTLEAVIDDHPQNPQPRWALASVYLEENRVEEALAMTQAALYLDEDVMESHLQRLIVVKFAQNEELFLRYANEALVVSPELEEEIRLIYAADLATKRSQLLFELY